MKIGVPQGLRGKDPGPWVRIWGRWGSMWGLGGPPGYMILVLGDGGSGSGGSRGARVQAGISCCACHIRICESSSLQILPSGTSLKQVCDTVSPSP